MENNKLICPVKRLNKDVVNLNVNMKENNDINISVDIKTKEAIEAICKQFQTKFKKYGIRK